MDDKTCGDCVHYHALSERMGECRHSPPQIYTIAEVKEIPKIDLLKPGTPQKQKITEWKVHSRYPPFAPSFPACGQFAEVRDEVMKEVRYRKKAKTRAELGMDDGALTVEDP